MKRQKKLKLEELKVQSFVTELSPEVSHTAKGGLAAEDGSDWCTPISQVVSEVVKSLFGASGASKWPCRKSCQPTTGTGGGGGGTGTGATYELSI